MAGYSGTPLWRKLGYIDGTRALALGAPAGYRGLLTLPKGVRVTWPKKASGVATDVTEDTIREVALPMGFVDVKVCAVDEVWSGLKLMIRRTER